MAHYKTPTLFICALITLCAITQIVHSDGLLSGSVEFHGVITEETISVDRERLDSIVMSNNHLTVDNKTWLNEDDITLAIKQSVESEAGSTVNLTVDVVGSGFDGAKFNVIMDHQ